MKGGNMSIDIRIRKMLYKPGEMKYYICNDIITISTRRIQT